MCGSNIWSILKFLFIYLVNMFIIYILNLLLNINSFLILPIGYIESVSDNCCKLFFILFINLSIFDSLKWVSKG